MRVFFCYVLILVGIYTGLFYLMSFPMIAFLFSIVDFLVLTWAFWLIAPGLCLWSYCYVKPKHTASFHFGPVFLMGLVVAACAYKWPVVREWLIPGKLWLTMAGYLFIGFLTTLIKWRTITQRFANADTSYFTAETEKYRIEQSLELPSGSLEVKTAGPEPEYYLHWKKFPFGTWWTYWPFFMFSIVLEPILNTVDWLMNRAKFIYEGMARNASIKVKPAPQKTC